MQCDFKIIKEEKNHAGPLPRLSHPTFQTVSGKVRVGWEAAKAGRNKGLGSKAEPQVRLGGEKVK